MFSEVLEIFSGGVGIISGVLSLLSGIERFPGGGGDIFRVIFFRCMGRLKLSKGGYTFSGIEIFSWGEGLKLLQGS